MLLVARLVLALFLLHRSIIGSNFGARPRSSTQGAKTALLDVFTRSVATSAVVLFTIGDGYLMALVATESGWDAEDVATTDVLCGGSRI